MVTLPSDLFPLARRALEGVRINRLFAKAVVDGRVQGKVLTDEASDPALFYVAHDYGMSLLYGELRTEGARAALRSYLLDEQCERGVAEWMQAYPESLCETVDELLGDQLRVPPPTSSAPATQHGEMVERYTRVNFAFDPEDYRKWRKTLGECPFPVVPTGREVFESPGGSVVPRFFWPDAATFGREGAGFSAMDGPRAVATAFSAYKDGGFLELGIETAEDMRGRGLALHVCAALIDYCMDNGLEPVWACRLENRASYRLAQRIGFVPTAYLPYYRLPARKPTP